MALKTSSGTLVPELSRLAHELRLFGIHGGLDRRSQEALATGLHPLEYLKMVLEDWDHGHERGVSKPQFKEIASLSFQQNRENLLIVGQTGTPLKNTRGSDSRSREFKPRH